MIITYQDTESKIFEACLVESLAYYEDGLVIDPFTVAQSLGDFYVGSHDIRIPKKSNRKTGNRKKKV